MGAGNLCHLGRCVGGLGLFPARTWRLVGRFALAWSCDDLRLVGLKLIFLIVTRAVSLLRRLRPENQSWGYRRT